MKTKVVFLTLASLLSLPFLAIAQTTIIESESNNDEGNNPSTSQSTPTQPNDSIKVEILNEVVVEASSSIETGSKTILYPSKIEKQHSTNGYELLTNMNLPELEVNPSTQEIKTLSGGDVVVLINGVEALKDELETLSGSDIVSIDFQRNPSGKYAGKGAVMNFITRQYEYGGNVFLSYNQGFTHLYGDFVGMISYKRKAFSATLTTSANWDNLEGRNPADNRFVFSNGILNQKVSTLDNTSHNNAEYGRLKLSHAENNHSLSFSLSLNRKAQPRRSIAEQVEYQGLWNGMSLVEKESRERSLSPRMILDYNLTLPRSQYFSLQSSLSFANTNLNSDYKEKSEYSYNDNATPATDQLIQNDTKEKNSSVNLYLTYQKRLNSGITLGAGVNDLYDHYRDEYSGNFTDCQKLDNNLFVILAIFSHSLPSKNLSYYMNLGTSSLVSRLNGSEDSQWHPMAFYGATYSPKPNHSFSLEGMLGHSVYDPSYKNDAIIFSSPFEATVGNPILKPMTAIENSLSYNGRLKNLRLSLSYDYVEYLDNLINNYFVEDDVVLRQMQNDGNFYYHTLHAGLSLNLFQGKLSIGGNGLISYTHLGSKIRPTKATIFRGSLNAVCFLGPWRLRAFYAPQRKAMNWDGSKLFDPTQYGVNAQWSHGNLTVECRVENFLKQYQGQKARSDYGCYKTSRMNLTNAQGRNISLKLVYTLSYGKKSHQNTEDSDTEINSNINSAILRPF